jgi:hypothetical protein
MLGKIEKNRRIDTRIATNFEIPPHVTPTTKGGVPVKPDVWGNLPETEASKDTRSDVAEHPVRDK